MGNLTTPESVQKLQMALHAKAKAEAGYRFYALYDKIYREDILAHAYAKCRSNKGAPGVDGQDFADVEAYGSERWLGELALALREETYRPAPIRRVFIPKANGKLRPLGISTLRDRVCMTAAMLVLEPVFEADLPPEQYAYRPGRNAQQAVTEVEELMFRGHPDIVDADLADYFGSLSHEWVLRFVEHRIGDPRMISLIRRWLKAGILEDGEVHPNEEGTPQGGSISVLLSNVYLHYVLDLWFERVVKPRLRGEARLVRYIDDFVLCFQYREDALRVQDALCKRLRKFGLTLEPSKTKLVEFGRFAQRHAAKRGRKRPETIYFLGFTLYCTRNLKGNFKVGMRTEKSRLRRSLMSLQDLMRRMRHLAVREQVSNLNTVLRGHYAYYGIAGNFRSLQKVHRAVERYWHKMLCSRSWAGRITWDVFHQIKQRHPILRPKLYIPYKELQALAVL